MNGLGELNALPVQPPFPFHGLLPRDPFEPGDQADARDDAVHGHQPGEQGLLLAGIEVEAGAHRQADAGVDDGDHRRPGEAERQRREDDGEQGQGGIVGHVAEQVELGTDDDGGGDESDVHGAEEQQPAPGNGPISPEPVVQKAVERHQRHAQEQVRLVVGVPEARSICEFDHADEPDEPARPD